MQMLEYFKQPINNLKWPNNPPWTLQIAMALIQGPKE